MKKIMAIVLIAMIVMSNMTFGFAAQGQKGASPKALAKASDEAAFHRVGDWFATIGKSEQEKKAIIAQRKAKRAAVRAQKEAEKKKKRMEKEMKKTQKNLKQQMKGTKKAVGK